MKVTKVFLQKKMFWSVNIWLQCNLCILNSEHILISLSITEIGINSVIFSSIMANVSQGKFMTIGDYFVMP